jgi:tripartite-type tricarboxylate transporter receptor subunit TctC
MNLYRYARKPKLLLVAACLGALASGDIKAQSYPDRPVRIIVPFSPGGGSDVTGRILALKFSEKFGQPFVVENRTGASGTIGAAFVARATPDGYTLLLGSGSEISQYPAVASSVPYNPVRDFTPIGMVAVVPLVLTVTEKLPVKSVQELIAYARANPEKLNSASGGIGSTSHLAVALFNTLTDTKMTHVPHRGSPQVVSELIAGNVDVAISTLSPVLPHAQGGKIRLLAVSTAQRSAMVPNLPTLDESGVKGYSVGLWTGLLAPAGTPSTIVDQLASALAEILAAPDLKGMLANQGAEMTVRTPSQFAQEIQRELDLWKNLAQKTGFRIN